MRLLIDEDTQAKLLVSMIRAAGHDIVTASEIGLDSMPDEEILAAARSINRVILTHLAFRLKGN